MEVTFKQPLGLVQRCPDHHTQRSPVRRVGDYWQAMQPPMILQRLALKTRTCKPQDRLGHRFRLDSLHADVVSVARGLVSLVQARAAKNACVKNLNKAQFLPVMFGVRWSKEANSWPLQRDRHMHWTRIVRQNAGSAIKQRKKFAEGQAPGRIDNSKPHLGSEPFEKTLYELGFIGSSHQRNLFSGRDELTDGPDHALSWPTALQQQIRCIWIDHNIG